MTLEILPGVYWVGIVDWGIRHFHGFELSTHRGTTYNSYLIRDEKTALVDTVFSPFTDEYLEQLKSLIDPAEIDYIIVNHAEPDHSGALPEIVRHCPNAQIIVSRKGAESVPGHYHGSWNIKIVKTGDKISLGKNELIFVEAPMLHWPDSMFTYLTGHHLLMPNDAFGQHYATSSRFNDQVNQEELYEEALKYYANILTPFSKLVIKKIDELLALNLPVDMIAPSHGVIWRVDPLQIVKQYRQWAQQIPEPRAVILYDTMWHATRKMAEALGAGLMDEDVNYKLFHMATADRNDVLTEIFKSRAIIIGSPTFNRGLLPTITPIIEDLEGLRFQNKIGAAFSSYGWSGEALKRIESHFERFGIPLAAPGVSAHWQPTAEDLDNCRKLGRQVAQTVKKAGLS